MITANRSFRCIECTLLIAVFAGCSPSHGRHRPLFSAGNCGLPAPLYSVAFDAPAGDVASAVRLAFRSEGWEPLQEPADQLEVLYRHLVREPAATQGLAGTHHQYLLVIVTPVKERVAKVSFVLSEFESGSDVGTSFGLVSPRSSIANYDGLMQSVRESLQVTPPPK